MSVTQCSWNDVAAGWDRWRDTIEGGDGVITDGLLAGTGSLDGLRVLELAGGNGELAARLVAEVGSGSVVTSDEAPAMVDLLVDRLAGLEHVEVARIDACEIPGPDAAYDAVLCRMGLMLVPDPARALSEIHRVLRPGGRLAAAVWADPAANPWMAAVGMAAMMHGLAGGGPPTQRGGPFSMADPAALAELVGGAGFSGVTVEAVDGVRRFASSDEHVAMVSSLAPPLAAALAAEPEKAPALGETVRQLTAAHVGTDGGLELPLRALVVSATA